MVAGNHHSCNCRMLRFLPGFQEEIPFKLKHSQFLNLLFGAGVGVAAGPLLVVLYSSYNNIAVPASYGNTCRLIPALPARIFCGLPIEVWGLGLLFLSCLLLKHDVTIFIAKTLLCCCLFFSLGLQFLTAQATGGYCVWCLVSSFGFAMTFLLAIAFKVTAKTETIFSAVILTGICFIIAASLAQTDFQDLTKSFSAIERDRVTEGGLRNRHLVIVFGSPDCPNCRNELLRLRHLEDNKKFKLLFRYTSLHHTRAEAVAAAGLKESIALNDAAMINYLLSDSTIFEKARRVKETILKSPIRMAQVMLGCQVDENIAKEAGITKIPKIVDCLPFKPCSE